MKDIRKFQDEVRRNNSEAQRKNKQRFDKKAKEKTFQPGDLVMVRIHRKKKGKRAKLADRFNGPWEVMAQVSVVNYIIEDTATKKQQTVHANNLKLIPGRRMQISEQEYNELFGESSDEEEFKGFATEDEQDEQDEQEDQEEQNAAKQDITREESLQVHRGMSSYKIFRLLPFLLIWIIAVCAVDGKSHIPNLGALYDCERATVKGIFATPSDKECTETLEMGNLRKYKAEVRKYHVIRTTFWMYYCDAQRITKRCEENFFGAESKDFDAKYIPVSTEQCRRAMTTKTTSYGILGKVRQNEWITMNTKEYHCSWLKNDREKYVKFRMRRFEAMIEGSEEVVQQHITSTTCLLKKMRCIPNEQKYGRIIWRPVRHDSSLFKTLGKYTIHQIGKFIMISELGIGGHVMKQDANMLLLDNTYIVKILDRMNSTNGTETIMKLAKEYAKKVGPSAATELFEGAVAKEIMKETQTTNTIIAMMCRMTAEVHRLQLLNIQHFTDTAADILYTEKGITITPLGDAYRVKKCKEIRRYKIMWDYMHQDKCYEFLPVQLPGNTTKFLELRTRRLFSRARAVSCEKRQAVLYIKDKEGEYWRLKKGKMKFTKVKLKYRFLKGRISLPKLQEYSPRLAHFEGTMPHRTTLLGMLAEQQESLEAVTDLRTKGGGNLIKGVARAMAKVAETVTNAADSIFHIIAGGVKHATNDTVLLVDSAASMIGSIFSFVGGAPNAALFLLNIAIVVYLVWLHFRIRRLNRMPRPRLVNVERISETRDEEWLPIPMIPTDEAYLEAKRAEPSGR